MSEERPVQEVTTGGHDSSESESGELAAENGTHRVSYSLACNPSERVFILMGMLLVPMMTVRVVIGLIQAAEARGVPFGELLSDNRAKWTALLLIVISTLLLLGGPIYLQMRSRTTFEMTSDGLRFSRRAFLPFGILTKDVSVTWTSVVGVAFRRRWVPFPLPMMCVRTGDQVLNVPLPYLWDDRLTKKRPWNAGAPKGGWQEHAALEAAQHLFISSRAAAARSA